MGGLPFALVEDHRGARHVAYPFSDNCDPLGRFDLESLEARAAEVGRPWVIRGSGRARSSVQVGVVQWIDLHGGVTALAEQSQRHRKHLGHVRRALRAGVRLRILDDPAAAVDAFYPLYSAFRKKRLGLLPQGRDYFLFLATEYFPDDGFVIVAEFAERIVGVAFLLRHGRALFYKYSATDYDFPSLGISNALIQASIEATVERGCDTLDLGLSGNESLEQFKAGIGARSRPVYRTVLGPTNDEAGADVQAAIHLLTELVVDPEYPLSLAQEAGAALYRYFA